MNHTDAWGTTPRESEERVKILISILKKEMNRRNKNNKRQETLDARPPPLDLCFSYQDKNVMKYE